MNDLRGVNFTALFQIIIEVTQDFTKIKAPVECNHGGFSCEAEYGLFHTESI
jgi:hypothetical protein